VTAPGIWRFATLFDDDGGPAARAAAGGLHLGEGDTPLLELPDLAAELGLASLGLKREDLNPSGSHKDRGVLYQVARHHRPGSRTTFVLSSSGNAAVAAAAATARSGDRLVAFVAPGTNHAKRAKLLAIGAIVVETVKPINFARYAARVFGLVDLRGTRDPIASIGYRSLAGEIAEARPEVSAVVTFSSSGISLRGIDDGFEALNGPRPALWAVQAGECLGIVRQTAPETVPERGCPAGRLGIRNPPDAPALATRLRETGGGAVGVHTEAILRWRDRLAALDAATSPEGCAVLAGVEALASGPLAGGDVVAILTGAADQWPADQPDADDDAIRLGSYLDVRAFFIELGHTPV
jgi:threonine synthase